MKNSLQKIARIIRIDCISKIKLLFFLTITTATSVLIPLITVDLIDTITSARNLNELVKYMFIFCASSIVEIIVNGISDIYFSIKEFEFTQRLKYKVMENLFLLSGEFFNEEKAGNLYTIIEDDTGKVGEFVYKIYNVLTAFLQAIAVMGVLTYLEWKLALIVILLIPFVLVLQNYYGNQLENKAENNRVDFGNSNALTEEFVANASAMIMFGNKKSFLEKYKLSIQRVQKSFKKLTFLNELSNQVLELSTTIILLIITGYGGYETFKGNITIGVLVVFLQYCVKFITPLENMILLKVSLNMIKPSLNRIDDIFTGSNPSDKKRTINDIEEIKLENVTFGYEEEQKVIKNADLSFKKNRKYLICGKSGIGKSTIINLILGFWNPNCGKILINGIDIKEYDIEQVRDRISIVSQKTFFLHDTIYNNLTNGNVNFEEGLIHKVLKQVEMYDDINKLPRKMDTIIGDDGMTLSGGQRQRLAIARALLKESDVFIFDEPTSALDLKTERVIAKTIENIRNKIVIIVSHSNVFGNIVDNIYEVKKNDIIIKEGREYGD